MLMQCGRSRRLSPFRGVPAVLALLLAGCANLGGAPERTRYEPPAVAPPPEITTQPLAQPGEPQPINQTAEATYHVLVGELALRRDQPDVAARAFLAALRSVPDLELAVRATQLALQAGDDTVALEAAELWLEMEPNAMDAREVVLRVHLLNDRLDAALPQALAVVDGHAAGTDEGFRSLGLLLARVPADMADSALELLQSVIDRRTDRAGGALALGSLALRFDQMALAESAANDAITQSPDDPSARFLMAGIKLRQGDEDEAIAMAEGAIAAEGDTRQRAELELAFAKVLLESGSVTPAKKLLLSALDNDSEVYEAHYLLGRIALREEDLSEATGRFQTLLDTPLQPAASLQLGRIAELRGHDNEALAFYSAVTRGPLAIEAANRRALVLIRMDRHAEALDLMQRLREELPGVNKRMLLLEVELLVTQQRLQDAIDLLGDALEQQPLDTDLRYARAIAFEQSGDLVLAEQDLRLILEQDAAEARTLNALGYLLVVQGVRLDEARPMIEQALALEPDDPAIMDTKGWLLFKEGDLEGALDWLQRAHTEYPDPEVAAHLGEVLWTLGRTDDALQIWRDAQAVDDQHPVLRETLQRLNAEP